MRQRHQDGGAADQRELADRAGAGAGDDELRRGHALRQIAEEGRQLGLHAERGIGGFRGVEILGTGLLNDVEAGALLGAEQRERGGNQLTEDAGALAAAEDEEA